MQKRRVGAHFQCNPHWSLEKRKTGPLVPRRQGLVPAPAAQPRFDMIIRRAFWTLGMQKSSTTVTSDGLDLQQSENKYVTRTLFGVNSQSGVIYCVID